MKRPLKQQDELRQTVQQLQKTVQKSNLQTSSKYLISLTGHPNPLK